MVPLLKSSKRSQQLQLWKRAVIISGIFFLLLMLWAQHIILTSKMDSVPAHIGKLHDATKLDSQHPDTKDNERAHLRDNKHLPVQTSAENGAANYAVKKQKGTDYDAARETPAHEHVASVADPNKITTAVLSDEQENRRLAVRKAMKFAWENYEEHAFGGDEVDPKNGMNRSNVWGNIACSLVDGIDTLWIMDLKDEFRRARDYVANQLDFSHLGRDGKKISVFETIIREVGGLLSAFDLSGDVVFKQKAKELMDLLTPAFDEKDGVFYTLFNPSTKEKSFAAWAGYRAHIADIGTLQLETRYLSDITGDPKYAKMGDAFYHIVKREGSFNKTGLFPVHFDVASGKFDTQDSSLTISGLGDSFYEYLLKVYIYSGKRKEDEYIHELYDDAMRGMEEHLLFFSTPDDLYFLEEKRVPSLAAVQRMDHFVCFVPGLLAMGTLFETEDHAKNDKHLELAEKLMETCYQLYHRQPTGLSPDVVSFPKMQVVGPKHHLRPEAIESLFYLYRVTKNPKYREFGWEIFEALETHAKVEHGYAAVVDVTELPAQTENKMESFFLAETLKYHYLLQAPESLIPIDEYVFNTEAHPLRIRSKN